MSTTENNPDVNVSSNPTHQEGIDHITAHSSAGGGSAPPASNPGSDDPSAGIAKDNGGVSGAAFVGSPVSSENKGYVAGAVEMARSYLPASLAGMNLGGGAGKDADVAPAETLAPEGGEKQEDSGVAGGAVAGAAAATTAATAAVVGGSTTSGESVEQAKQDSSSSSTAPIYSPLVPSSEPERSATETKDEPMADAAPQKENAAPVSAPAPTEEKKDDAPAEKEGGEEGGRKVSHAMKETWPKENRDAIPTAGGEQLGKKHWGESDTIPDAGKKEEKVSSAEGQPDEKTQSNTAANTGGAKPPVSGDVSGDHSEKETGGEKPKFADKMKEKLHMGSKQ
ncbi:uncharacterized protein LTR77_003896 [Saxophila tyrrhenica]|uniref:Uncharacterized protein n=1 Tax=Saxophila tyrrhenica TaxID=1690608 RepID=A0AAV9PHM1_9PEZI|nr:hypothetical protein LTR77_003896 [Saxophila tyrrhenica]